jgi:hypothetical protein
VLKNLIFIELMIAIGTAIFYILSARATRRDVGIMPGIVFGLMAAIAFLSPNLIVAYIAVGLIPLAFGRTKVQVGIIVAAGLFALPTLPTNLMLGTAWLFPWTMQTTVALGGLIAMLVAPGRMGRAPPWADASMIMVILVLIFIDARAGAPIGYLRGFATYFFDYAIPVFLITRCARNPTEWRTLLAAIAAIGCILAAVVLYEARGGWPLYSPLYGHYGFPVESVVKFRGGVMRAYGSLEEATAWRNARDLLLCGLGSAARFCLKPRLCRYCQPDCRRNACAAIARRHDRHCCRVRRQFILSAGHRQCDAGWAGGIVAQRHLCRNDRFRIVRCPDFNQSRRSARVRRLSHAIASPRHAGILEKSDHRR